MVPKISSTETSSFAISGVIPNKFLQHVEGSQYFRMFGTLHLYLYPSF